MCVVPVVGDERERNIKNIVEQRREWIQQVNNNDAKRLRCAFHSIHAHCAHTRHQHQQQHSHREPFNSLFSFLSFRSIRRRVGASVVPCPFRSTRSRTHDTVCAYRMRLLSQTEPRPYYDNNDSRSIRIHVRPCARLFLSFRLTQFSVSLFAAWLHARAFFCANVTYSSLARLLTCCLPLECCSIDRLYSAHGARVSACVCVCDRTRPHSCLSVYRQRCLCTSSCIACVESLVLFGCARAAAAAACCCCCIRWINGDRRGIVVCSMPMSARACDRLGMRIVHLWIGEGEVTA